MKTRCNNSRILRLSSNAGALALKILLSMLFLLLLVYAASPRARASSEEIPDLKSVRGDMAFARQLKPDSPLIPASAVIFFDPDNSGESLNAELIGGVPFVNFREFCERMGAVGIDENSNTALAETPYFSIRAEVGLEYLVVGDRCVLASPGCFFNTATGELMAPLRAVAAAFGARATRLENAHVIFISGFTAASATDIGYTEEDLYWMSRIIQAEAAGEPLLGKIAVGNVITNRASDPSCPDDIHDIIFDRRTGVQFTPAYSGAINNTPSEESIIAAKIALGGGNVAGSSLFFSNKNGGCWAKRNRPYAMTIGNHAFFF
jgi:hypothetical protein